MFYHVFILSSLLTLAIATPNPRGGARSPDSCSTGPIRCCDAVYAASDPPAAAILQSIGVVVQDPQDTLVGLNCTSVTVVGVGPGNQRSTYPMCCQDNSHGSLISIDCVPVTA